MRGTFPTEVDVSRLHRKQLVWERPCRLHIVFIAAEAVVLPQIKHFGWGWPTTYGFFRRGMVKFVWNMKDMTENGLHILNNFMDKEYFDEKISIWKKLCKQMYDFFGRLDETTFEDLSDSELITLYANYNKLYVDWWGFGQVSESIGFGAEYVLRQIVNNDKYHILTAPIDKSYTKIEEDEIIELAIEAKENGIGSVKDKINEHAKKYYWLQNSFYECKVLSEEFFAERVKKAINDKIEYENLDEVKQKKETLMKQLKFRDDYKRLVQLADYFTAFQDLRKEIALKANHYVQLFVNQAVKSTGISEELLMLSTSYEYGDLIRNKFDIKKLEERKEHMTLLVSEKEMKIFSGKESEDIEKRICKEADKTIKELKGTKAFGGKVKGKVAKVLDPRNVKDYKEGSVLVTTMTSPDFVPLIKKSIAIVTDEGGITCHAAIVAREFKIPCIMATGNATTLLNNDDEVEVDADNSLVRIL